MTPIVKGQVHTFEHGGLYDGLFLMRDRETGSTWNHITGECVYGPLKGAVLAVDMLALMTAEQAANRFSEVQLALSKMPWYLRLFTRFQQRRASMEAKGILPPQFRKTMGDPDPRLPEMEIGLGVWSDSTSRFYSRQRVVEAGNAVIDRFEGRSMVVFIDPESKAPTAVYADAKTITWHGTVLNLGNGTHLQDGRLVANDSSQNPDRPLQMLTRWYGFQYTFPECEVYQK